MTPLQPSALNLQPSAAGPARRLVVMMIGLVIWPLAVYTFLALQSGAWQLWVAGSAVFVYLLGLLVSLQLTRRGRVLLAVSIMVHGLSVGLIVFTLVIAGFGALMGLTTILFSIAVAGQTLTVRSARAILIVSLGFGLLNLLLDLFLPPYRLESPELQIFVPVALIGLIMIYGVSAFRQFQAYQFATKLVAALLAVSLLPTIGLTVYTQQTLRATLQEQASAKLSSIAELQASALGETLIKAAELLQTLALNDALQAEVRQANANYPVDDAARQAQLLANDGVWRAAVQANDDAAPLLRARLDNPIAMELLKYRSVYPENTEVFATDLYGGLVAATNRTSDFYQADEAWWQTATNNGRGSIYFSQPEFDASSATFSLIIALPIYAQPGNKMLGILRTTYRIDALIDLLDYLQAGKAGRTDLMLPDNNLVYRDRLAPAAVELQQGLTGLQTGVVEAKVGGVVNFAAVAEVRSGDPEEGVAVDQLAWRVVVQEPRSEVLAPVQDQTRTVLLVTVVIAIGVAGLAVGLSQILVRPIRRLTTVANQVAAGDLTALAQVESGDEFGILARAFNSMTGQLRVLITSLEDRVRARTEALRASADVSRATTSILDTDQLLREAVNLITDRFGFYYTAIFMLDATGQVATLREATGEAGRALKERGQQLEVNPLSTVGRALTTRQACIALEAEVEAARTLAVDPRLPNTRSEIALPLIVGQRIIGALDAQSEQAGAFDQTNAAVLQSMADQIAVALINAETLGRAEQQAHVLTHLNQLSHELAQATSLDSIARAAATAVVNLIGPQVTSLALKSNQSDMFAVHVLQLDRDQVLGSAQLLPIINTLIGLVIQRGETQYVADLAKVAAQYQDAAVLVQAGRRSLVALPLRLRERTFGALNVINAQPNAYSAGQIIQLEQLATQLGVALESFNLAEQTRATLQELDAANRRLSGQAWERYTRSAGTLEGEWRAGQWLTPPSRASRRRVRPPGACPSKFAVKPSANSASRPLIHAPGRRTIGRLPRP